ncbi:GNAT family N-acetyltransferase [Streptomyces sioyaensis]|uniref:GNAT family N-acetyltransferase n=1 Tax=Streptomyces sioyaensis TaxID=67364 RepID=UPI003797E2D4
MREIFDAAEVAGLCGGDALIRWAAQGLPAGRGIRAFAAPDGSAVAVASPALSGHDRLAVHGEPRTAAPLVRDVLRAVGRSYRPIGGRELIHAVHAALPWQLQLAANFGWMERSRGRADGLAPTGPDEAGGSGATGRDEAGGSAWTGLDEAGGPAGTGPDEAGAPAPGRLTAADGDEIAALLDAAFPDSYAHPSRPGVQRWFGVRERAPRADDGRTAAGGPLVSVAAHAWCAPDLGCLAGVATAAAARGRGLGRAVCKVAVEDALARYGTVALMVADANRAALDLYRSLGLVHRPLAAAFFGAATAG